MGFLSKMAAGWFLGKKMNGSKIGTTFDMVVGGLVANEQKKEITDKLDRIVAAQERRLELEERQLAKEEDREFIEIARKAGMGKFIDEILLEDDL